MRFFFIAAAFVAIASVSHADVIVELDATDAGAAGVSIDDTGDIASTAAALAAGTGAQRLGAPSGADSLDRGTSTGAASPPVDEPEPTDEPVSNAVMAIAANRWFAPAVTIGLVAAGLVAAATVQRRSRRRRRRRRSSRSRHRHHHQTVHSHKVVKSS